MVCVFARKTSEPLASLVKQIDRKIGENGKLKSFVVITTKEKEATAGQLRKLARDASIQHVPLTTYGELDGPPDYELARNADLTVMMWNENKVKVNRGFKGALTDENIRTILTEIPKLLGD